MKIINFILILLFYTCICNDQLMKLEMNKISERNTGDYKETYVMKNLEEHSNYTSSYNAYPILNNYLMDQLILPKDKILRLNDSIASKKNLEFEPKENDTSRAAFQIFKCGSTSYPKLAITYNSQKIIQQDYQRDEVLSYDFSYDLDCVKASIEFEGDFLIYYHLYSTQRKNKYLSNLNASIDSVNFNNKTIILTIQPYVVDEESEYKIYYAKNGTIPTNMNSCEALEYYR